MSKQIIGILGGMGPQATCDLFQKLIDATPATSDQEHVHIIIDNNPQIPDRTKGIQGTGPDPVPELVATAKRLAAAGCNFVLIPCNTAHYYAKQVEEKAGVTVLSMIETVAEVAAQRLPKGATVGIVATNGTLQTGLYHDALRRHGLVPIQPEENDQAEVMDIIYGPHGVKAGFRDAPLRRRCRMVAERLVARGAQAVIAGCTEIPLVLEDGDLTVPVLDTTGLLAKEAIRRAMAGEGRPLQPTC